ncbi:hypothetical protein EPUL_006669, partial [Erysiphe pulchra]
PHHPPFPDSTICPLPSPPQIHPPPLTSSQNTSLPNIQVVNRKFLEPVPPSKRAAQDAADPDSSCQLNEEDPTLRYLPPELAKIFSARQQQERAWHIRLMVCSSFISNIDSTVNNFQEGEEKETARKIQSQLLAAISQFAAADVYPASPSFRNPSKLKHSIEELKALTQKKTFQVAVPLVTPIAKPTLKKIPAHKHPLPKKPQVQEDSWVKVVRNGHKKSRATKESVELKESNAQAQGSATPTGLHIDKNQSSLNTEVKRLFIRLSQDHEWCNLSPAGIREVIVRKLSISQTCIKFIKPVRSGFALSPYNTQAREALLQTAVRLSSLGTKLESATNWTPVIIPTVLKTICTTEGSLEVTKSMLGDEVERVTGIRPCALKLYGHSRHEAPHRTWMAFFKKAPRPGFRVFDESGIMRNFKRKQSIDFCNRYNGHHLARNCSRAPSCGNCGSTMHAEDK